MICAVCREAAEAMCVFCGRFVCATHLRESPYVSGFTGVGGVFSTPNGVRVENAVWCGRCRLDYRRTM